jgi:hypothetical protein
VAGPRSAISGGQLVLDRFDSDCILSGLRQCAKQKGLSAPVLATRPTLKML